MMPTPCVRSPLSSENGPRGSPTSSSPPSNHLYEIKATLHGGRGAFARTTIPKDTPILSCAGPYASVILRAFKKEVCAWCFAYSFENGKSKWSVKLSAEAGGVDAGGAAGGAAGAWFCSERCKELWVKEHEVVKEEGVGWWLEVNGAFERLVGQMGKTGAKDGNKKARGGKENSSTRLAYLDVLKTEDVTPELVDEAWSVVEKISSGLGTGIELTQPLNELELDTARYLLDGLIRKIAEDSDAYTSRPPPTESSIVMRAGLWADYLELQDNEVPHVRSKPYVLASHINIYRFLRQLPHLLSGSQDAPARPIYLLRECLSTSTVVRALLQRDPGNVFGIWDMAPDGEESEMLGWGAYVFGSYFNHDCEPSIKKRRDGRSIVFYTIRDVGAGEELCISYIDDAPVGERNTQLARDWFFACSCAKCIRERAAAS